MKFAFVTTFFGPHSFGGDAAYVDRLSRALLRDGHQVDVIYNKDAFDVLAGDHPTRDYQKPPGMRLFPLSTRVKSLSMFATHQTGSPIYYKRALERLFQTNLYDVIHFHNISLIGGPGLFRLFTGRSKPLRIMTTHEHWLICPLSLLWKMNARVCDSPQCIRCTLQAGRPPQFWRYLSQPLAQSDQLDALISPSQHTRSLHQQQGVRIPHYRLPYFIPDDWTHSISEIRTFSERTRPYFAVAGRLVKEKGIHTLLSVMQKFPNHDLLIAGTGPMQKYLEQQTQALPNVHMLGYLSERHIAALFQSAVAVIVPSLFYETFGYVVLEAFAVRTPVLVRDIGALPELMYASGAGAVYSTEKDLVLEMKRLSENHDYRNELGEKGWQAWRYQYSETNHLRMYFTILDEVRRSGKVA